MQLRSYVPVGTAFLPGVRMVGVVPYKQKLLTDLHAFNV